MREFLSHQFGGFVGGLLAGALVTGLGAWMVTVWFADEIAEAALAATPTCTDPRGLEVIDAHHNRSVRRVLQGRGTYGPNEAIDGYGGSIWMPRIVAPNNAHRGGLAKQVPLFRDSSHSRTLTLTFPEEQEVRLVCVSNGMASQPVDYMNWGRVRTVEVWGEDAGETNVTTLQTLDSQRFQELQRAASSLGTTDSVSIELIDAYAGSRAELFDIDVCLDADAAQAYEDNAGLTDNSEPRYGDGCIRGPNPLTGLSEVVLYTPSD